MPLMTEDELHDWLSFNDGPTVYPFTEDENCNIHGYGHQDKAEFAEAINRYDLEVGGVDPEDAGWTADDITHRWAVMDPGQEYFWVVTGPESAREPVTADTPDAFPITCLWNSR